MSNSLIDNAIEILRATHDGNDLAPPHLKLVELAVISWVLMSVTLTATRAGALVDPTTFPLETAGN